MGDKRRDNFWTVEKIAEVFRKDSCKKEGCGEEIRDKMTSLYIREKIKEILKEIDCSESIFRRRAKKQDGHFIFEGNDSVPDKIYRIFEFYDLHRDKICGSFMSNEESELIGMLFEIRPLFRQKPCNNTYMEQRKSLKGFYVNKYLRIYKQKLFVAVDVKDIGSNRRVCSNIYYYQMSLVKGWYEKWSFLMKTAMYLRINERILNGYRCGLKSSLTNGEDRKRFYLEGQWFDELEDYLKGEQLDEEEIYNACCIWYYAKSEEVLRRTRRREKETFPSRCRKACVSYVRKILSHSLLDVSIEDYLYMLHKAKEELEEIHKEVEEELQIVKGYDNIVYALKQILMMVKEDGLKGKKNKRLKRILVEATEGIDWQDMSDEKDNICKKLSNIVKEEKNYCELKRTVIDFCSKEIEKYNNLLELKEGRRLPYSEYKKYFSKEMLETIIDKKKEDRNNYIDYQLVEAHRDVLLRTLIKRKDLNKEKKLITDFLPEEEKKKYWSIRKYYTDRELI